MVDHEDLRLSDENGGGKSGMDLDQGLEGGLTPPARPGRPPPLTFQLPPAPPPIEGSPLLNTDADTNYVENGDDGSKRLKVDATVGQTVPDASTLSKALRRGQYTSDEARMLRKSVAKFLEESQEELVDVAATAAHFGEHKDGKMASHDAGWSLVLKRCTKKRLSKKRVVGDLKRSAVI